MKTNSFEDPRLARAILGHRRRIVRHIVISVPVNESIEFKIIQKKRELDMSISINYQVMFLGEWRNVSLEDYKRCQQLNMNVRLC